MISLFLYSSGMLGRSRASHRDNAEECHACAGGRSDGQNIGGAQTLNLRPWRRRRPPSSHHQTITLYGNGWAWATSVVSSYTGGPTLEHVHRFPGVVGCRGGGDGGLALQQACFFSRNGPTARPSHHGGYCGSRYAIGTVRRGSGRVRVTSRSLARKKECCKGSWGRRRGRHDTTFDGMWDGGVDLWLPTAKRRPFHSTPILAFLSSRPAAYLLHPSNGLMP